MNKNAPGTTRSSLPTLQRRRNTTRPGMTAQFTEGSRAIFFRTNPYAKSFSHSTTTVVLLHFKRCS